MSVVVLLKCVRCGYSAGWLESATDERKMSDVIFTKWRGRILRGTNLSSASTLDKLKPAYPILNYTNCGLRLLHN